MIVNQNRTIHMCTGVVQVSMDNGMKTMVLAKWYCTILISVYMIYSSTWLPRLAWTMVTTVYVPGGLGWIHFVTRDLHSATELYHQVGCCIENKKRNTIINK